MSGVDQKTRNTCTQLQSEFAVLIRTQMQQQGISVRKLVEDGAIKRSHRNGFFNRIVHGTISTAEFNRVTELLGIDPVRAAITVTCFETADSYDDPCCETSAQVATALAHHLSEEVSACGRDFEPIRESLCAGIAKKTSTAIVKHQSDLEERRHNPELFGHAFG